MAGDPDRFDDLFASFGKVAVRRMFGAEGLFRDGLMFGIVYREKMYFKTNEESRHAFLAEGASPLYYEFKNVEGVLTSYYELPDRLYDDPDELAEWVRAAIAVARNKSAAKKKSGPKRKLRKKSRPAAAKKKKPAKKRR